MRLEWPVMMFIFTNQSMEAVMLKKWMIISVLLLCTACGGDSIKRIEQCVQPFELISTNDIEFAVHKIVPEGNYSRISGEIENKNYFCYSHVGIDLRIYHCDQAQKTFADIQETTTFPSGTTMLIQGSAIKVKSWGLNAVDTGEFPLIYLKAKINGETFWIHDHDIAGMFASSERFKHTNLAAWHLLEGDQDIKSPEEIKAIKAAYSYDQDVVRYMLSFKDLAICK